MPSLSPSIQAVLSLRSSCSGALSEETLAAVQNVQNMIQNGTHSDGWLKVKGPSVVGRGFRPSASSNSWSSGGGGGGGGGGKSRNVASSNGRYTNVASNDMNIARNFRSGAPAASGGGNGWTSVGIPKPRSTGAPTAKGPVPKYKSVFKSENDDKEGIILNSIIQGKLNKFSEDNYSDVKGFLQQILDGDEQNFLKSFMVLVFQMAADQESFCPLYAKLLGELSVDYPVLLKEMNELHSKYLSVFENVATKEDPSTDYDAFVRQNKEKKYRLGYSQFLAELVRLNILAEEVLEGTLRKILSEMTTLHVQEGKTAMLEEYSDCMVRMLKAFNGNENHIVSRRRLLKEKFGADIQQFTVITPEAVSMRPKIKFAMMNIMDILNK
jgi:hypothetical protein